MTGGGDTPAEPSAGAFGRWLLQERELRGLPRDEVARLTKLGPAIIEALESGDPGRMPPRAYVFGYLRAYAAAVRVPSSAARTSPRRGDDRSAEAHRSRPPHRRLR